MAQVNSLKSLNRESADVSKSDLGRLVLSNKNAIVVIGIFVFIAY